MLGTTLNSTQLLLRVLKVTVSTQTPPPVRMALTDCNPDRQVYKLPQSILVSADDGF